MYGNMYRNNIKIRRAGRHAKPSQAAVLISEDGTNWDAWTTYQTGAHEGPC